MNGEDLRFLASRAEHVHGRADNRLAEVHARIAHARRRRAVEAVTGTSAAVLALVIGVVLVAGPVGPKKGDGPIPPITSEAPAKAVRKIIYSDNQVNIRHRAPTPLFRVVTIQVGDREVRIDQVARTVSSWALRVTDGGAVYAKDDRTVWLTDGGEPRRIAARACVDTTQADGLAAGNAGPWAVWFDCSAASRGADLVVYDTVAGQEVARHSVPECRGRSRAWPAARCSLSDVVGEHVYFSALVDPAGDVSRGFVLDVASDTVVATTPATYAEDIAGNPRGLVIGNDLQSGVRSSGLQQVFRAVGPRLLPVADSDLSQFATTSGFDTATGAEVRLRLPEGYHAVRNDPTDDPPFFVLFEWLDDDTVALARGNTGTHFGDILVCHLSDGRCAVAVAAPRGDATRIVAHLWPPG
jgi:hypothetical protein